jgi:REP element-mobilizing transposase RayT
LTRVVVHLVFSTKERRNFLCDAVREPMHRYLATVARDQGCVCYRVGGTANHVHLALGLGSTCAIAHLVERLKTTSSTWVKRDFPGQDTFAWQRGYGCFSVNPRELEALREYIENQEAHHRTRTFEEEFRMFLERYGVEYEERYVWG